MMELTLIRTRHAEGTNGTLSHEGNHVCHTIELPWLENMRNVSCIPDGRYVLQKRFSVKRGEHLVVTDVPERSGILIHPANYALEQLRGCIAPVTTLTGPGRGTQSCAATATLHALVFAAMKRKEEVILTIKAN
jgi:hypothetical protein